ncbi:MAG: response regulator transcription factor [Coriobacteriaceae bacterium]|nr:response regulator transcription factor [Coriobacteriaceae bacterium]
MKILMIDDDESMQALVSTLVKATGYDFAGLLDGAGALEAVQQHQPDLILLDVVMPSCDGFEVCRTLRASGVTVPIIFLSAKGDIFDKMVGFQAGGDDYFAKPFEPQELLLHIQSFLRRERQASRMREEKQNVGTLKLDRFEFDQAKFIVRKDGTPIQLTPKEFNILFTLACNANEVVSQQQLVETAWGEEYQGEITSLAVYARRIRKKVEDDPSNPEHLVTCWGSGYMWQS